MPKKKAALKPKYAFFGDAKKTLIAFSIAMALWISFGIWAIISVTKNTYAAEPKKNFAGKMCPLPVTTKSDPCIQYQEKALNVLKDGESTSDYAIPPERISQLAIAYSLLYQNCRDIERQGKKNNMKMLSHIKEILNQIEKKIICLFASHDELKKITSF